MADNRERGRTWNDAEVAALIAAWSDESVQLQLQGMVRNEIPFTILIRKFFFHSVSFQPAATILQNV